MKTTHLVSILCLAGAVILGIGCSPKAGVSTVPVTGIVTIDGSPAEGIAVTFSPQSPGARTAAGITDANGRFTLNTPGGGEGAVPGSYKVVFAAVGGGQAAPAGDPRAAGGALSPEQMKQIKEAQAKPPAGGPAIKLPAKYTSVDTSDFTVEVKAGAKNEFTFDLKSQ